MYVSKYIKYCCVLAAGAFLLSGCVKRPTEFSRVEAIHKDKPLKIGNIRFTALKNTAHGLGAQAGLSWRAKKINDLLTSESRTLDKVFNFNAMLLDSNVLPPVLVEGRDTLNMDNNTTLRIVGRDYKIIYPPRFVTAAPSWRDYIWMNFTKPKLPDYTLLPKNATERKVWNKYVARGWNDGVEQANEIFATNLGRLKRDFNGMVLYKKLYASHMVSAPYVAKDALGVTGGGNSMHINDRILRITTIPQLNPNSKTWKPVFTGDMTNKDSASFDPSLDNTSSTSSQVSAKQKMLRAIGVPCDK